MRCRLLFQKVSVVMTDRGADEGVSEAAAER